MDEEDYISLVSNAVKALKKNEEEHSALLARRNQAIYIAIVEGNLSQSSLAFVLGITRQRMGQIVRDMTISAPVVTKPDPVVGPDIERMMAEYIAEVEADAKANPVILDVPTDS